jgi:serine O-acetyltransferase
MISTSFAELLDRVCADRRAYALPKQADRLAHECVRDAMALLFPHFAEGRSCNRARVEEELSGLLRRIDAFPKRDGTSTEPLGEAVVRRLFTIRGQLLDDAAAIVTTDPAAHTLDEVILAYPGFFALGCYRIAHELLGLGVLLLPRLITEIAHRGTGVDIHPAARIGQALAIDHGTGIVVGETAVIGNRVRLYQGVTLGALRVEKHLARSKRHPTLEDDVVVYANATILGGETVVGRGSVIGGNVWLTHSVPPGSVITHGATVEHHPSAPGAVPDADI